MNLLIKQIFNCYRNLILYCIIGCVGAGLDFIIFSVLTLYFDVYHQFANVIGVVTGILINFFLNYYFNFKSNGKIFLRMLSFFSVGLLGLGISALSLWFFVDKIMLHEVIAKIITVFLVTAVQYTLNKMISFRKANYVK